LRLVQTRRGKFYHAYCSARYEIHENLPQLEEMRPFWHGTIVCTWKSTPSVDDQQYIFDMLNKHFRSAHTGVELHWHDDRKGYFHAPTDSLK